MKNYLNCITCSGKGTVLNNKTGENERCIDCDEREFRENTEKYLPFDKLVLVKNFLDKTPQRIMFQYSNPDFTIGRNWHVEKHELGLIRRDDSIWVPRKSVFQDYYDGKAKEAFENSTEGAYEQAEEKELV